MQKIHLKSKSLNRITYYKTGKGPTIFLVHGFPANIHLWRHITEDLAKNYSLILPNFFEEEGDWLDPEHKISMDLLAEAFNDILDHEGIQKVLYIGHSMGGYMGLALAEKYPEKIIGLSLVHSSPLPDDEARTEGRKKTVSILESGGKSLFLKKMVPALFPTHFAQENADIIARQLEEALAVDTKSLVAFYRAIMERKSTTHVTAQAHFPIQLIIGIKDSLANIKKELDAQNLSFVNFVNIYEQEGHMAMLENPKKVLQDVQYFATYCLDNQQI